MPAAPPGLPGLAEMPSLARVCQRLRLSPADLDARYTVDEVLDEVDLQLYLYDCDAEPSGPPAPPPSGGRGRRAGG